MSNASERRLTAILAADVANYSKLMGEDEAATLTALRRFRNDILTPAIVAHNGRVIKSMGDGWLVEFPSVVNSIECAMAVQNALTDDPRITLRMGLHSGDVSFADEDVYGDGINVAARLQDLAEPGSLVISETARRSLDARLSDHLTCLGSQKLKNIAEPLVAYGWGMSASAIQRYLLEVPERPSIAVLAFDNVSQNTDQTFFAEGIAEDVISALSRFHWFFVISRNTSFSYRGRAIGTEQIARDLGVQYVLEGSVRRVGNRVRVSVKLIDAIANHYVWTDRFDGVIEDIFDLQDEITQKIVGAVAPEYLTAEMQRARRKVVPRMDAWELSARAHWHISQFTKADVAEAQNLLMKAVELDPQSSFGMADLSFTHLMQCVNGWSDDPDASKAEAVSLAQRAVSMNGRDAYAMALLGAADLFSGHHQDAVRKLRDAIALNPNDPHAHALLARAQVYLGDGKEALGNIMTAIRLSPRDPFMALWYSIRSLCGFVAGRHEEAIEWAEASIRAQPNRGSSYLDLAVNNALCGKLDEARQAVLDLKRLDPGASLQLAERTHPFARSDDHKRYQQGLRAAGLNR
ncbi:tetratricopeptide repeat protein [Ruegeria sp. Ofav3-42]|uniref:tetratricopeptide repeat protein n=1 Tax=Ruegeria sp. Ofav3-42 TaxID=2917759 RepID=UPI001EF6D7B6|nr:tetratricopeptide repeat protein [Ruegeria sp. Ofav3-42]MCG7522345.1 adenylate/guanylate cyclase domain-containing protein [Ruegeria sp. Ofav3-42]